MSREPKRVHAVVAPPQLTGGQRQDSHQRGTEHCPVRADEQGVEKNPDDSHHCAIPFAKDVFEDGKENPRDDGDVETRDGDDVRRACVLECGLKFLRHACVHAEQNPRQQGRFGIVIQAIGIFEQLRFEFVNKPKEEVPAVAWQGGDLESGHGRVDALPRKIIAVGKFLVLGRSLQTATHPHPLTVFIIRKRRGADEKHSRCGHVAAA